LGRLTCRKARAFAKQS